MLNKLFGNKLNQSIRLCTQTRLSAQRGFATGTNPKENIKLNQEWLNIANKETKGRVDVHEKLIKTTNEQMHIKPIYTSEDWSPPEHPEISGK